MSEASGKATTANRVYALDALRGLAILAMLLAGQLPFGHGALPAWMYHAQEPPPHHEWLGNVPGITWVDLVFPFFIFCMGAAFPLAFARRMEQGVPTWRVGLSVLGRGFLLGFFALYVADIRPYVLSKEPGTEVWLLALLGFFLLFPVLTRLPEGWSVRTKWQLKAAGWAGVILFLALARYPEPKHPGFWLGRSDIIMVVLTNLAVFGSLIWILTRDRLLPRLGVLGIVFALRLSNLPLPDTGWVSAVMHYSPAPWIFQMNYLQYLCIVIPGTIAGDLILNWTRASSEPADHPEARPPWPQDRCIAIAGLMFSFVVVLLVGLGTRVPVTDPTAPAAAVFAIDGVQYMRPWLLPATLLTFVMCGAGAWLLRRPGNATERLYQRLFLWAIYWLVLGLVFESYEGGIKKDHPTMSYYFVTAGLASCTLIGLSVIIDRFKCRRGWQLLIANGQNPMIAYAGINNFITPVLFLTGGMSALTKLEAPPWLGFLRGLIIVLLMAVTVSWLTRRKIFWRT